MNKLKKLKALHGRSLETGYSLTSRKCSAWASEARNAAKCSDQSLKSSRLKFNPHSIKDQRLKACATRTLLQRSNSVTADHRRHILFSSLRRSASLRRNYRSDANSVEVVVRMHGTDDDRKNCSNYDLNVLRDLPYTPEIFTSDDTSPLILSDVEPFGVARNSFNNHEITGSRSSLIGDYSVTAVPVVSNVAVGDNRPVDAQQSTKRDRPELRILTPGYESGINCNLRKMSAVDERHMNEAIELANSFSRLLADDKARSGQRTPGSFSDECRSPGGHFFGFHKSRPEKEEKLTFAEELSLLATEADRVVTPAALEAYEALVKKAVPLKENLRGHFEDSTLLNGINDSASSESSHEPLFLPDRKCAKVPILTDSHALISGDDVDLPSRNFPAGTCQARESSVLSRSLSLGNAEKLRENDEKTGVVDVQLPSLSLLPEKVSDFEDILPPAYHAPSPPSKLQTVRTELLRQHSEPVKAPFVTAEDCPPPLPEKKSRKDGEILPTPDDSPPQYQAPLPPPPALPPPALPPRIPLKPSTVNSRPYERHFPLASEIPPHHSRDGGIPDVLSCRTRNQPQKILRQTSASAVQETRPRVRETLSKGLCDSVESRLSSDSDVGNVTRESEENALGDSVPPRRPARPCTVGRSLATPNAGGTNHLLKLNIKNIKLNAAELGLHDKADLFWVKSVNFDLPERSLSERDLLQDVCAPIPGRYETSDSVSYEDLMEFALDGSSKTSSSHSLMCDEVRLLMKLFSNDITVEDCMAALAETCWDVHSAVKLIKLKQVMSTGLADKQQCKQALLFCRWNVNDAALYLLTPPQQRITPNLVDV